MVYQSLMGSNEAKRDFEFQVAFTEEQLKRFLYGSKDKVGEEDGN